MSSTWNGSALQSRFAGKHGFTDTTSLTRVLEYINDIQLDLVAGKRLPFLKFKMKKYVAASTNQIDLSPEIPGAATAAIAAGGSLTADTAYTVKVTFLIMDETQTELNSIESEPGSSVSATPTGTDLSINLTAIPTMSGSTSILPTTIYRRIYLQKGTAGYFLYSTIQDNTTTTLSITADTTSTIEPPEFSMVDMISGEDPYIEANGRWLTECSMDEIIKYDPNMTSTGTPSYYARSGKRKIFLYPTPSAAITISYWVYRLPSRIFADTTRVIQIDPTFKKALDAGVVWKGYEYKDSDGQESKLSNYEQLKSDAVATFKFTGGMAGTVKRAWS